MLLSFSFPSFLSLSVSMSFFISDLISFSIFLSCLPLISVSVSSFVCGIVVANSWGFVTSLPELALESSVFSGSISLLSSLIIQKCSRGNLYFLRLSVMILWYCSWIACEVSTPYSLYIRSSNSPTDRQSSMMACISSSPQHASWAMSKRVSLFHKI